MNRLRRHPLFLLPIALALPLAMAFLYYDFYDNHDLVCLNQISTADNEDLLGFLRKNTRLSITVHAPLQYAGINLFEANSFLSIDPASTAQTVSVLRC